VLSAYAHLTDPSITQTDAIRALKRARKAATLARTSAARGTALLGCAEGSDTAAGASVGTHLVDPIETDSSNLEAKETPC
jgi:hypothetical protein